MSLYIVKIEGQVLTEPLPLKVACQIAADLNGENVKIFGETYEDIGLNVYEVSIASPSDADPLHCNYCNHPIRDTHIETVDGVDCYHCNHCGWDWQIKE